MRRRRPTCRDDQTRVVSESPERTTSWLRRAGPADAVAIADLFLASFRATYDFPLAHTDESVRGWIRDEIVASAETWVAVEAPLSSAGGMAAAGGTIAGFMTLGESELDQLYVGPGSWGRGFGSRLLALAVTRRPDGLGLYTFQANSRARAFYEQRGFTIVDLDDGARNEERQPDIRYRWTPGAQALPGARAPLPAPSPASREEVRSADGTPIVAFRTGDGPPLILVHGATADHATFRVVGPMFARHHAVHAVDRRGRGASGDVAPYAIEREYEDLAAVIDAVASETRGPVDVVAHSFGGAVALGAATLTQNVRRLVLYESAAAVPGLDDPPPESVARLRALERAGDRAGLLRVFLREIVGLTDAKLAEFEASPVYQERLAAAPTVLRELIAGGPVDHAAAASLAAAVPVPVLQLLGSESAAFFGETTLLLDAALPAGRVVILDGQRHAAHHEAAEVFVAEVEAFLDR